MPLGVVTDDDFFKEFGTTVEKVVPSVIIPEIIPLDRPGRKEGDNNVPDSLRQIIGEESVINGRQSALGIAKSFGISPASVSAYANGATSTASYDTPVKSIISHINKARKRAIKKATTTLNASLEAITQEKLDYTDAKDLSVIAKNMSAIVKDLEPQAEPDGDKSAPQFVIFAPQFRDERSYETLVVKEE